MNAETRLSVLPDERRLILGVDGNNVFEPGIVYKVEKINSMVVLTPIGKYALPENGCPSEKSTIGDIASLGLHLVTQEEKNNHNPLYEELLLGVRERPKGCLDDIKEIYQMIDSGKIAVAKHRLSRLAEKLGDEDAEITRARLHIDFADQANTSDE